jgi:hypothetical protein
LALTVILINAPRLWFSPRFADLEADRHQRRFIDELAIVSVRAGAVEGFAKAVQRLFCSAEPHAGSWEIPVDGTERDNADRRSAS